MPLFEVAAIKKPTKKEAEDGKQEELVHAPTAVIAQDEKSAAIIALRKSELTDADLSRVEVLVRPFA